MDDFEKRQQKKYKTALQHCATVAHEEYENAQKALAEAETLIQELRRGMKAVRIDTQAGSTVQNAQASLADLNRRLDRIVTEQLTATSASLAKKKSRLEKFTVTLFGRTMSGKSTIREALTHGDGGTIGKGNQRTTRDLREYEWNQLRIVDTPGIGAYAGKADSEIAKSVIDESDILLFLVSSDSIQEASFRAMQDLRDQNKPVIFVLNVKHDLTQPVYRRSSSSLPTPSWVREFLLVTSLESASLRPMSWESTMLPSFRFMHKQPSWRLNPNILSRALSCIGRAAWMIFWRN